MNLDLGQILDSLGWALLHSVWQCMLAAIVVIMFRALTKDNQATLRYSFQLFSLFLCLAAFGFTFVFYQMQPSLTGSFTQNGSPLTSITALFGDKGMAVGAGSGRTFTASLTQYTPLLAIFWCLGFAVIAFRYIGAFFITQHLRRTGLSQVPAQWKRRFETLVLNSGIRRQVEVFISDRVSGPLTLGFFKPIVLVPASFFTQLPSDQVEAILLHEIAHIRRHDYLINLFQTVIRTIFFFHPAVYFISYLIDNDREHACDDFAVALTKNPKALARGLVALRLSSSPNQFALAADNGNTPLLARLNRLGYGSTSRRRPEHVVTSIGTLALAAALIPATSPFAGAQPAPSEDNIHYAAHPSAKLGNYRFEKITKDNREFTAKIASDGTRWINVDGAWHDVDTCPEMIEDLPVIPVSPAPPKTSSPEKQIQFEIDQAYYEARVALETITEASAKPKPAAPAAPLYNSAELDNYMRTLKQQRQASFIQTHKSREDLQQAFKRTQYVTPPTQISVTASANTLESVASWETEKQRKTETKSKSKNLKPKAGIHIDGEHVDVPSADDWMGSFVDDMVRVETELALNKITHKEAEKAREKAQKRLDTLIKNAQAVRDHKHYEKIKQQERIRKHTKRNADETRRIHQIAYNDKARHTVKYKNFNRDMLAQLKTDGLINPSANQVTITYPNRKMVVNGVSVPYHIEDNYCGILDAYNIEKRHNARIEISRNAFNYSSTTGNSTHIIEEEFESFKEASLTPKFSPDRTNPGSLQATSINYMPASTQQWLNQSNSKPRISYKLNHISEPSKFIQASNTTRMVWTPGEREMSAAHGNAHLSPN